MTLNYHLKNKAQIKTQLKHETWTKWKFKINIFNEMSNHLIGNFHIKFNLTNKLVANL